MKKFGSFIIDILCVISILIITGTIYFCLDVFGVINVPSQYSIASLFYSKIEVIATGTELDPDDIVIDSQNRKIIRREKEDNYVDYSNTEPKEIVFNWEERQENPNEGEGEKIEYEVNARRFYYDQLNKHAKMIYDELKDHMDELKTGEYNANFDLKFNDLLHEEGGRETLDDAFQFAINALTFDNPELFYIDVTKIYLSTEIRSFAFSTSYRVTVGQNMDSGEKYLADGFNNESDVNEAIQKVEDVKYRLVDECQGNDTVQKIRVIHDYLVDNVEYDSANGRNVYNIYGTLVDGRSVCEGYARSMKYILDDLNIPCIIACGIGQNRNGNTESHAWNYIYLDDAWYALDATWDDPIIINNGKLTDEYRYAYFLKGSNEFFKNHFEDGNIVDKSNFKYPEISREDY